MKVPAIVATGVICLVIGVGGGILTMMEFGYTLKEPESKTTPQAMGGGRGGPGGNRQGGIGGMFRGPSPKNQLATLVTKLDLLTKKPLAIHLNEEERAKMREQLQGLADKDKLSDKEAKKRLDAVLKILEAQKDTLTAAGYRWPGQGRGGFRPPADAPNPFKEKQNGQHLQSLQQQLAKPIPTEVQ
jgi:hypothetical protein